MRAARFAPPISDLKYRNRGMWRAGSPANLASAFFVRLARHDASRRTFSRTQSDTLHVLRKPGW